MMASMLHKRLIYVNLDHVSIDLIFPMPLCNASKIITMSPYGIYLFKVNRNNRAICKICSKLTIKTPERSLSHCSGVFIVNFEQISHNILVFPLLTFNK